MTSVVHIFGGLARIACELLLESFNRAPLQLYYFCTWIIDVSAKDRKHMHLAEVLQEPGTAVCLLVFIKLGCLDAKNTL